MKVLRKWKNDSHRYFTFGKPWQKYAFLFPGEKNIKCSAMNKQQRTLITSFNFTAQVFPVHPCQKAAKNSNQIKQTKSEKNIKKKQSSTSVSQRDEFCHTAAANDNNVFIIITSICDQIIYTILMAYPVRKLSLT